MLYDIRCHVNRRGSELLAALVDCSDPGPDLYNASYALHRAIPLHWRLWYGVPWTRRLDILQHDIAAYRLTLGRSEVVALIDRAIKRVEP